MVYLTATTMDLLWDVLRNAPTVAVEMMFVLLVIIVTMVALDSLRMCFTTITITTGNYLNPLEALSQVEEEQNYETSEKILRDVSEIRSKISQIELNVQQIRKIIYVLQDKIESLESKQDATLSELLRLSQVCDEVNTSTKVF